MSARKTILGVLLLTSIPGCYAERAVRRESPEESAPATTRPAPEPARPPVTPVPTEKEMAAPRPGDGGAGADKTTRTKLAEDPHRKVPHASEPAVAPSAAPRVRLPGSPEAARSALPDTFRVAVALVRDGRLANDEKAFLAVARALEADRRVKGVLRVRIEADETDAKGLAEAAHREGARLLVIDVAGGAPLVLVCDAPSGAVLARLEGAAARETEPAASDVARWIAFRTIGR